MLQHDHFTVYSNTTCSLVKQHANFTTSTVTSDSHEYHKNTSVDDKKTSKLQGQLTLVRRTMTLRQELQRIRWDQEQAQLAHEQTCRKANDHLVFLTARSQVRVK